MKSKTLPQTNSLKHTLLTIFPPFVLALTFYPLITGLYFNASLVEIAEPMVTLALITLIMALRFVTGKNAFYYIGVSLLFINQFITLAHWIIIKSPRSQNSLFVVFNSHTNEAAGFMELNSGPSYLLVIPFVILFILSLKYTFHYPRQDQGQNKTLGTILVITLIFLSIRAYMGGPREATPLLVRSVHLFHKELNKYKALKGESQFRTDAIKDAVLLNRDKPRVVVLVEGESVNRNHMSLYGYYRNTTPLLQELDDLIVYTDVVSGYGTTYKSIAGALTQSNLENNIEPYEGFSFMDVCRASGVMSYWLSNHSPIGFWNNFTTLLAEQSDKTEWVNLTTNSDVLISYDEKLLGVFEKTLNDEVENKFIFVHLMGSHDRYSERYPPGFARFKGESHKDQTIAHYDNSILYTDYIVDSLIKIMKVYADQKDVAVAMVHVADHGEDVYDDSDDYAGHGFAGVIPTSIVEIPFMVWLSPQYKTQYPEKSQTVSDHAHLPYVTDDQFHSLIDLMGIENEIFEPRRSVFNTDYNFKRTRIIMDGSNYDSIK